MELATAVRKVDNKEVKKRIKQGIMSFELNFGTAGVVKSIEPFIWRCRNEFKKIKGIAKAWNWELRSTGIMSI
jgi:hypothetical protein